VIAVDVELAQGLTVVRGDHDGGVVQYAEIRELVQDAPDVLVGVPDPGVVAVEHAAHRRHGVDLEGLARVAPGSLGVRPESHRLLRRVRARALPVALAHLLRQPAGKRVVAKRLAELRGNAVGRVGIPQVHVQEPAVPRAVAPQPVVGDRRGLVGVLETHLADVVRLIEAGQPVVGRVTGRERADRRGAQTGARQPPREAAAADARPVAPLRSVDEEVGGRAAVADDAGVDAEAAGQERGAAGQAGRVGRVAALEADSLGRDPVDVGARVAVMAVAAQVIGPQRVDVDVEHPQGRAPARRTGIQSTLGGTNPNRCALLSTVPASA
jgi:hypothetical protein